MKNQEREEAETSPLNGCFRVESFFLAELPRSQPSKVGTPFKAPYALGLSAYPDGPFSALGPRSLLLPSIPPPSPSRTPQRIPDPVHAHRGSPAAIDGAASDSGAPDEEPYTIKCICSFDEDDGNTVFCEGCETWQHILCYYPDKKVPDVHNCVDCEPRPLTIAVPTNDNGSGGSGRKARTVTGNQDDLAPKHKSESLTMPSVEDFAKRSEEAMDRSRWPSLTTETITDSTIEIGGKHPVHKILKTQDPVRKDDVVGEIFGQLGHVKDYKKLDSNRWKELGHAMPFVFFNRQLDLYIDSRQEGNELRHVRRSCEANVNLKIYITNGRQYHFCFVAKRDIPANSEITTMCTTLANFGGCACGNPQTCVLNKLDRRAKPPANKRPKSKVKGKGKKPKPLGIHDIGRAGSDTKHSDEHDPPADTRSNSGSARGRHTGSRDLSPTALQLTLPALSSRERRKIADAEKQFQQLEQLKTVNPKRKKRSSGHPRRSTLATVSSSTQTGDGFKPYHEPGVTRSSEMAGQSPQPQVAYVDAQTELYADDVERSFLRAERLRRGYKLDMIHPTLMLKIRWCAGHHIAEDWAQRNAWESGDLSVVPSGVLPWWYGWFPLPIDDRPHIELLQEDSDRMGIPADHGPLAMPPRWSFHQSKYPQPEYKYHGIAIRGMHYDLPARPNQGDVDTRSAMSYRLESSASGPGSDLLKPAVPPYWPSTAAHTFRMPGAGNRGNLHVSMPPPRASNIPSALSPGSMSTGSLASPSSHRHSFANFSHANFWFCTRSHTCQEETQSW
ncbi:hypothetical protein N7497_012383 [Penicillium chrysogenum]|nr:hypothetical protein N7497_012383 [Penicillium chrysogenum]